MRKALLYGGGALAATIAIAGGLVALGYWTPWADRYVMGVDVSNHQGAIDWRALASTDVRFAYIKASEGGDHRDARFAVNWRDAEAAGLKRGAYHFFTLCRGGREQAANFIGAVPRDPAALPPAVDLEHMGPCRRGPRIADIPFEIALYADEIEAHYGARPIFYTTRQFHDAFLSGRFPDERFWIRSLFRWPSFRRQNWVFWQHHNKARRAGVSGPVDLNSFRGDKNAFTAFARSERKSAIEPET